MLEIITGHTGIDHVTSADDASLYRAVFGAQDVVLNTGSQFEHTVVSNNLIRINDGDLVIQGHQARIRTNDYEELVIDNGTPGQQRHDLIVARYEKNAVSGIESVNLAIVKGTPATTASDPDITRDDITSGGTLRDFPLYRVRLNGINIGSVEKLFNVVRQDLKELQLESGSNSDGQWFKIGDYLVCYQAYMETDSVSTQYNYYRKTWNYPQPFASTPYVGPSLTGGAGVVLEELVHIRSSKDLTNSQITIGSSGTVNAGIKIAFSAIAIGRGK